MGISALRRVQVAQEGTAFTAAAALYRLVGMEADLVFAPEFDMIGGFLGGFARTSKWYITGRSGTGSLKGPLLKDVEGLIPFLFSMHDHEKTGSGTPYTYLFQTIFDAIPLTPTMTMEFGDQTEIMQGIGGIITGWTLTGAVNKAVQVDANIQFSDVSSTALAAFTTIAPGTPDFSDGSRHPGVVLTNNLHFMVDGVDTGVDLIGFTFNYNSGLSLEPRIDGTPATNKLVYGIPEIEGQFTIETGAKEAAMFSALVAETAHVYALQDDASAPTFKVEWTGQPADVGSIGDSNGAASIPFTVREIYRPELAVNPLEVTMIVANSSFA